MRARTIRHVALLLVSLAARDASAAPRPITHEDLWLMPRVGAPAISPNGRWSIVPVAEPSYAADGQAVDLWLVDNDGKQAPHRLTSGREAESGPAFSPDGRRLAFAVQRAGDEAPQVYVLDLDRPGEAQRATSISTGARQPRFSPDGRRVLFVSDVHPDAANDADSRRLADERKARKYNARVFTGFPIRNWDRWLDERRPHVFVQTLGEPEAHDLLAGTQLAARPGYGGRTLYSGNELDAVWSPDGAEIVFAASRNRDRAAFDFTHTDLWAVPVRGGEPRRLTGVDDPAAGGDSWSQPRFSADGRVLLALRTPRSGRIYDAARIAAWRWPALSELPTITAPDALAAVSYGIAGDNRTVWFTAETRGQEALYRAELGKRRAVRVSRNAHGSYSNLVVAGDAQAPVLIANYESATEPTEVARLSTVGQPHQPLSAFASARAAALDLAPVEHFESKTADGRAIDNMLVRPPNFDPAKQYPLFVLIHGGPHIMWRDQFFLRWNYHLLAAPGYVVLLTNYTGSTGYGEAFAQAIQGDPLRGPADEINRAADEAIRRYPFVDGTRQCAGGASYGAHLANWLQATTTRYRCLVSHAGLINLESQWGTSDIAWNREVASGGPVWEQGPVWREQNPIRYAAQFKTPVLVSIGENDFRVPLNNALEYWTALQRQRVESRLLVFPDENHWILKGENSRYHYQELHAWLGRWLQ